ncbi:hypothetical protein OBBRIDRAFT_736908, partial [Obba rivulosa]
FYEHVATLSQESNLLWGSKRSGVTILFFVNRWTTCALGVVTLLNIVTWSTNLVNPFSALRVFAIGARNWYLTLLTLGLGLVPCITNTVSIPSPRKPQYSPERRSSSSSV